MSIYVQDLDKLIANKLYSESIYNLAYINSRWNRLLSYNYWKDSFVSSFNGFLTTTDNYETYYLLYESVYLRYVFMYSLMLKEYDLALKTLERSKQAHRIEDAIDLDFEIVEASEKGNIDAVSFLLIKGASVNALNGAPLIRAVKNKNVELVKLLLANGADTNLRDNFAFKESIKLYNKNIYNILNEHKTLTIT